MKAELKGLHSPDVLDDLPDLPVAGEPLCVLVQALIGPEGQEGEESFNFVVCDPAWLARELTHERYVLGRHYLFVERFDWALVEEAIRKLCDEAAGETWAEVTAKLARWGHWEFEDYQPYSAPE